MTEDLLALLRADLDDQRPPPLGDLVAAAIRDGRRLRLWRRIGAVGVTSAALGLCVSAAVLIGDGWAANGRGSVAELGSAPGGLDVEPAAPAPAAAPTGAPQARTLTFHSGTQRADGQRTRVTPAAMLQLLTLLLPPGRTSHYGASVDNDLRVQLRLDDGHGPAMVRVALGESENNDRLSDETAHGGVIEVTIHHMPDNCAESTVVDAARPDGVRVEVDVPTCLVDTDGRSRSTRPALTVEQAIRVATDPRWGITMDEQLVSVGDRQFPTVPVSG